MATPSYQRPFYGETGHKIILNEGDGANSIPFFVFCSRIDGIEVLPLNDTHGIYNVYAQAS